MSASPAQPLNPLIESDNDVDLAAVQARCCHDFQDDPHCEICGLPSSVWVQRLVDQKAALRQQNGELRQALAEAQRARVIPLHSQGRWGRVLCAFAHDALCTAIGVWWMAGISGWWVAALCVVNVALRMRFGAAPV